MSNYSFAQKNYIKERKSYLIKLHFNINAKFMWYEKGGGDTRSKYVQKQEIHSYVQGCLGLYVHI